MGPIRTFCASHRANYVHYRGMDILVDVNRVAALRKKMGLNQDELGACLEGSRRTVQRIEDASSPPRIETDEMNRLAKCLKVQPYMLWGELPVQYEYTVEKVKSGAIFSELLLNYQIDDFQPGALPEGEWQQEQLINLASIIDTLKSEPLTAHSSFKEQIEWQTHIKNVFDKATGRREIVQWEKVTELDVFFSLVSFAVMHGGTDDLKECAFWETRLSLQIVQSGCPPRQCTVGTVRKRVPWRTDYSDENILNDRPVF